MSRLGRPQKPTAVFRKKTCAAEPWQRLCTFHHGLWCWRQMDHVQQSLWCSTCCSECMARAWQQCRFCTPAPCQPPLIRLRHASHVAHHVAVKPTAQTAWLEKGGSRSGPGQPVPPSGQEPQQHLCAAYAGHPGNEVSVACTSSHTYVVWGAQRHGVASGNRAAPATVSRPHPVCYSPSHTRTNHQYKLMMRVRQ